MLITKRLAMIITLKCNLNCKLCCNCVPQYKNPPIIPKEDILNDMDELFKIYDKIEWLQFVGGELFLHPNLDEILLKTNEHIDRFDKIILMTNGGVMPRESVLKAIKNLKRDIEVQISDYGTLSPKVKEIEAKLKSYDINFKTKPFYGDIQHYGGWVDCGGFDDRNYTACQLKNTFENCWQIGMENLHTYNGKLHNCIRSLFGLDLKKLDIPNNEYIDLRSDAPISEKKKIAQNFNTKPLYACSFCSGFDSANSKRYPAAEQV